MGAVPINAKKPDNVWQRKKNAFVKQVAEQKYEFGFTTNVDTEIIDKGLNEDVVRLISRKKGEPDWLLDFRLQAFAIGRHWSNPVGDMSSCPR